MKLQRQQNTENKVRRVEIAAACEAGHAVTAGSCEDCGWSEAAGGRSERILTCHNRAGGLGRMWVVGADESCCNFTRDKELLAPELVAALAEGAKLIPLTQGEFAIVDAEDYEWLNQYKWHIKKGDSTYYAGSQKKGKSFRMHRLITKAPKGLMVDHINHNGLDNRRRNLRFCTREQNAQNSRPRQGTSSRYKGVSWVKARNCYRAFIQHNGKRISIGRFKSEIAAAEAYDKKAKELFGEFAYLNFP